MPSPRALQMTQSLRYSVQSHVQKQQVHFHAQHWLDQTTQGHRRPAPLQERLGCYKSNDEGCRLLSETTLLLSCCVKFRTEHMQKLVYQSEEDNRHRNWPAHEKVPLCDLFHEK